MRSPVDEFAAATLGSLESQGLLRPPEDGAGREEAVAAAGDLGVPFVDASSNDYLGLAGLIVSRETSVQALSAEAPGDHSAPNGAGASRLIHGTRAAHLALEGALARWVGAPSALLFSSGYAANIGLLQALGAPGSLIVSDALNHASIVDGCRLSGARVVVTPHLDLGAVKAALASSTESPKWVVVESYFSMDGDEANLAGLRSLCDSHGAGLVVDEAHALGIFGPGGAGRCMESGMRPDALVGTLGKAVGVQGAFIAGSSQLRALLWNRARSFIFSTAPSPALCAAALFHVERARAADAARARLGQLASTFRAALRASGARLPERGAGPIVPVLVGTNERALGLAQRLRAAGILAQAIRYPTVPEGTARVRLTVSAAWPDGAVERVAEQVALGLRELP